MVTRHAYTYVNLLAAALLLASCRALPETPQEALNRLPDYVPTPEGYRAETATIAATVDAAGGKVIVYRWQSSDAAQGPCRLAAAFVTPDGLGWRPQSTLSLVEPLDGDCQTQALIAGTLSGSEASALTAVFGASDHGVAVRLRWPDGQVQVVALSNGIFVQARPEVFAACDLELLDEFGNVIETESLT